MDNEKGIYLSKEDFAEEQWKILCDEFEADTNGVYIMCMVDLNSVSQGI